MPNALKLGLVIAGVALLFALPSLAGSEYAIALGVTFCVFAVLSGGLNLVFGYAGLLSYAQVGFFGIGAYATGILVTDYRVSFWLALLAGGALAALVSALIGYASLRLSRHAFGIASLVFALLCAIAARDWVEVTRGPMGMPGLAVPVTALPGGGGFSVDTPARFFYVIAAIAVASNALFYAIMHSRIGRAMQAVRFNEPLARSQGLNPLALRLLALGVSAFTAALVGGVFVFYLSIVDPSIFDFYYTEAMLIMTIVGGAGNFWTVLLCTAVFTVLPDLLRVSPDLRLVLYGAILIVAMLVMPGGLGGWLHERRLARWRHPGRQRTLRAGLLEAK